MKTIYKPQIKTSNQVFIHLLLKYTILCSASSPTIKHAELVIISKCPLSSLNYFILVKRTCFGVISLGYSFAQTLTLLGGKSFSFSRFDLEMFYVEVHQTNLSRKKQISGRAKVTAILHTSLH